MSNIHSSAIISEEAILGKNVKIGPFCIIGPKVKLGDNVVLHSHIVLEGKTTIGNNNVIFPFASIGHAPQDLKFQNEDSEVIIGDNNIIREYVTIQPGTIGDKMKTIIGNNCLLMVGTHIAHDCIVGNNVICANMATIAGHVSIGDFTVLGGLSAVHQHVRIGEHVMVGGLTAVLRDVAPFAMVSSDRSEISGLNLVGLKRRGIEKSDIFTLQKAFNKIFFTENLSMLDAIKEVRQEYGENIFVKQLLEFMELESKRSYTTANYKR